MKSSKSLYLYRSGIRHRQNGWIDMSFRTAGEGLEGHAVLVLLLRRPRGSRHAGPIAGSQFSGDHVAFESHGQ